MSSWKNISYDFKERIIAASFQNTIVNYSTDCSQVENNQPSSRHSTRFTPRSDHTMLRKAEEMGIKVVTCQTLQASCSRLKFMTEQLEN